MDKNVEKKENLTQQASKGAFWGMASNLIVSAMSFVGTAIMARILSPNDFGLIGMAVLVTGIINLFGNLGLGAALVQKKNVDDEYLSTAFWASILVSVVLFLMGIIAAPFASMFFNESAIKWVIIYLSFNFVVSSFSAVHATLLYKKIRLKNIGMAEIFSRLLRIVIMLYCAKIGLRFWSIVIGMILERVVKTILLISMNPWRPSFVFSKHKFFELFRFGRNIYGQGFLGYFSRNIDFIITGKLLGAGVLGIYQFSYNLPYLVQAYVQDGIAPVAFPVFSKVNDDKVRLARGFLSALKYIAIITFPLMVGLAFCSVDFITIVYSEKWLLAAGPLRILSISAAFASIHAIDWTVFSALGNPAISLKWALFRLPITIISVVFCSRWGIVGIASAMFFVEICSTWLSYMAMRNLNTSFKQYLLSLMPAVVGSGLMFISLFVLKFTMFRIDNIFLRFTINVLFGISVYLVSLFVFYKKDFSGMINFVKLSINKRKEK